jgi:uncharacterized protein YjbI with pentapeptide repeats
MVWELSDEGRCVNDRRRMLEDAARRRTPLRDQVLHDADLAGARLDGLRADFLDATRADLSSASLRDAQLLDCDFVSARLTRSDFTRATLWQCTFHNADATRSSFVECTAENNFWSDCDFTGADFEGAVLSHTSLHNANLEGTTLQRVQAVGANLTGARLAGASLRSASFRDAQLRNADLRQADLEGGDFRNADFTGARLDEVRWDGARVDGARFDPGAGPNRASTAGTPASTTRRRSGSSPLSPPPRFLGLTMAECRPLFDRATLRQVLETLQGFELLAAEQWGLGHYDHPFDLDRILLIANGEYSPHLLCLKRTHRCKHETSITVSDRAVVTVRLAPKTPARDWPLLFDLADALTEVLEPDIAWVHPFSPEPQIPLDEENLVRHSMDASIVGGGAHYRDDGPGGLGARTYLSPRLTQLLGGELLSTIPAATAKLKTRGTRIDLVQDPWNASWPELLTAWQTATEHLKPAGVLTHTQAGTRGGCATQQAIDSNHLGVPLRPAARTQAGAPTHDHLPSPSTVARELRTPWCAQR